MILGIDLPVPGTSNERRRHLRLRDARLSWLSLIELALRATTRGLIQKTIYKNVSKSHPRSSRAEEDRILSSANLLSDYHSTYLGIYHSHHSHQIMCFGHEVSLPLRSPNPPMLSPNSTDLVELHVVKSRTGRAAPKAREQRGQLQQNRPILPRQPRKSRKQQRHSSSSSRSRSNSTVLPVTPPPSQLRRRVSPCPPYLVPASLGGRDLRDGI